MVLHQDSEPIKAFIAGVANVFIGAYLKGANNQTLGLGSDILQLMF